MWHKIADVPPRENQQVLVAIRLKDRPRPRVELLWYRHGRWLDLANEEAATDDNVLGWMPLPPFPDGWIR